MGVPYGSRESSQLSETPNPTDAIEPSMNSEQLLAIFFTLLMVGSAIAYGAVSLI